MAMDIPSLLGGAILAVAAVGLVPAGPALADDGSSGVALPGLASLPTGSVRALAAELDLDADAVVLRLRLQLPGTAGTLVLRGPLFGWLGDGETSGQRRPTA